MKLNCGMSEHTVTILTYEKGMNVVILMEASLCFKIHTDIYPVFPQVERHIYIYICRVILSLEVPNYCL
jgi:hypothetical protein